MAEFQEYLDLGVNIDARIRGANETMQMIDKINDKVQKLQRTVSESSSYNASLTSSDTEGMMNHVVDSSRKVREELDGSRSAFSDLASFGSSLSKDFSSIATVLDGQSMLDLSGKSYGDLSKLYEQYSKEVQKFKEAVNVSIISHEMYTLKQLDDLAQQEDVVKEKMQLLRDGLQQLDDRAKTMSFAQFMELNGQLAEAQKKLSSLSADRNALANTLTDALRIGGDAEGIAQMQSRLKSLDAEIIDAKTHAQGLQDTLDEAGKFWKDDVNVDAAKKMTSALETEEKSLNAVHRAQERVLNASPADTQRSFSRVFTQYEFAKKKLSEVEMAMKEVGDAGEEAGTKSAKGASSFAKEINSAVKSGWTSFLKTSRKELKGISSAISNVRKSIANWRKDQKSIAEQAKTFYNTFNSLWRMLKTRAKRRLVGLIFEDLTATVGAVAKLEPRFNTAISGFIVSAKTLGAQIIASLEPLASIVLPILSKFMDYLTAGAAELAQFISRATGDTKFIQAIKGQYDYAASLDKTTSSTKNANKAAKEYKNTVMSFDQLHKLNGDDDGLEEDLGLNGVDLAKVDDKVDAVNTLGERLWDALTKHDFAEAGRVMGDAVNMGFSWLSDKFGWEKNGEKFSGWLRNITDALNGFIDELDAKTIGQAIGDIGNTFIELFKQWTEDFDYYDFGKKIGEILGNAVQTINWHDLGQAIIQGIQGTVKTINGFIESTVENEETGEMESIFTSLGHALAQLFAGMVDAFSPQDWADLLSGLVNGFFEFLSAMFSDPDKAAELGKKLAQTLNLTIKQLDAEKITGGINAFTASFTNLVESFVTELDWSSAWEKLKEIISGLNWADLAETIAIAFAPALIGGVTKAIISLVGSTGKWLLSLIFGSGATSSGIASAGGSLMVKLAELCILLGSIAGILAEEKWGLFSKGADKLAEENVYKAAMINPNLLKDTEPEVWNELNLGSMNDQGKREAITRWFADNGYKFDEDWDTIVAHHYGINLKELSRQKALEDEYERIKAQSVGFEMNDGTYTIVKDNSGGDFISSMASLALKPAFEDFIGPKMQEMKDAMTEMYADDTLLGNMDGETFQTSLDETIREATALPETSVAGQDSEEFLSSLNENIGATLWSAATMIAEQIAADRETSVQIDGREVARAVHKADASMNKTQNPHWNNSPAYA